MHIYNILLGIYVLLCKYNKWRKSYVSQFVTFNVPTGSTFITIFAYTVNKDIIQLDAASHAETLNEFGRTWTGILKEK